MSAGEDGAAAALVGTLADGLFAGLPAGLPGAFVTAPPGAFAAGLSVEFPGALADGFVIPADELGERVTDV